MSLWHEITDKDNVDYNPAFDSIDIDLGSDDNYGEEYVTIPVKFIIEVLKEQGYNINK